MPVPTSISAPTRPRTRIRPLVGKAIRVASFSAVVFPAPLWPMIANDSPSAISRVRSSTAVTTSRAGAGGRAAAEVVAERSVLAAPAVSLGDVVE